MAKFDLERFVAAQASVIDQVREELARGRKQTHWMWFVFPQIAGLGSSPMARRYAIASRAEAVAFLSHPVLGARLSDCTSLALGCGIVDAHRIFGSPDDLKFHSSMTLFDDASRGAVPYREALDRFFAGRMDALTLDRLDAGT